MNRLRELRSERGITQEQLGKMLGVQKAAVCKYESGRVPLTAEVISELCAFFEVTADYLLGLSPAPTEQRSATVVIVPLVGRVHAGLPMLAEENIVEYLPISAADAVSGESFYMEVEGDCMTGEFIPEGALVLVKRQPRVENGQIAVVRIGDEVLLRKVKWLDSRLILIPANPKYEPLIISGGDVEVIGRVVEVRIRGL